jgi:hypothetical protein
MAAQLREDPTVTSPRPAASRPSRSPEELRSMMSSIQQGTRRGRAESLDNEES